jgi:hypothetical protein
MPATLASLLALLVLLFCGKWSPALAETPLKAGGLAFLPTRSATSIPLNNPGFEESERCWLPDPQKAFVIDKSEAHDGSASLRFDAKTATKWVPSVRYPLPSVTPGVYRLRFWIKTEQLESPKDGGAGVRVSIEYRSQDGNQERWVATRVYSGTRQWELAELAVPLPETLKKGSACISIHRYRTPLGGKAWFDDFSLDRMEPPPVESFLCYPNFRGFLPANGLKKIRLWLQVNDATRRDPVRIVVRRADDAVVASQSVDGLGSGRILELEAGAWPLGEYHVDVSIGDYHYPNYIIQKVSDADYLKLAVRFDQDNVLNMRGTRTFPLGLYTTSGYSNEPKSYLDSHLKKISEAPINFLINYWLGGAPIEAKRAYLVAQRKYGINYLATVNNFHAKQYSDNTPLLRSIFPEAGGTLAEEGQADVFVQRYAKALRIEPNFAGWYVMDERPFGDVPLHFRQYQVLRQADPDHLTLGISNRVGELAYWRDTVDVLGMDPYPLFNMKLGTPLTLVGTQTRATVEATHGSRPVWMVLQFFQGWSADRWPTEEELRTMSLMAITEGARGLFYWSFGARALAWVKDPKEKEAYWQRLVNVTKELKSLEPALLAPDAPDLLARVSDTAIRWRARAINGKCYVFAYLPAKTFSARFETPPTDVTFTLKDGRTITKTFRPDTADWFAVDLAEK